MNECELKAHLTALVAEAGHPLIAAVKGFQLPGKLREVVAEAGKQEREVECSLMDAQNSVKCAALTRGEPQLQAALFVLEGEFERVRHGDMATRP